MIYNNLLYFLVVILTFSTASVPQSPTLPPDLAAAVFLIKALLFLLWLVDVHRRRGVRNDRQYFQVEQKFSILAVLAFAVDLYLLDCKYYLTSLSLNGRMPALVNLGGLALFFFYLAMIWSVARRSYQRVFERRYPPGAFIIYNIRQNLPIVIPWLFLSLLSDLIRLVPLPFFQKISASQWGEPLFFLVFFLMLATFFPWLIKHLWDCRPMPDGPLRSHIKEFLSRQHFGYSEIMLWPLYEGRVLTAGVMGLSRRLRYLLVTPALIEAMSLRELEAVMAHEIGHAKKHHLQLYLLLFLGFALLLSLISSPVLYLMLSSDFFYALLSFTNSEPEAVIAFWWTIPLFLIMIVYFRFIFGFFMRNFERQADLHVFKALGDSLPLISSLEKIGWLSGNIRDKPSWHHFGIGQRVDYLKKCRENPALIKRQDRKVYASLLLYLVFMTAGSISIWNLPMERLDLRAKNKFVESVLAQKIRQEPDRALWRRLKGDFLIELGRDGEAMTAYSKALALEPGNPEILNNLAWLLITTDRPELRDPVKALSLAMSAANRRPEGYVLDTLAEAHWANGDTGRAVATERRAMARDPGNREYYRRQIQKFTSRQWPAQGEQTANGNASDSVDQ